MAKISDCTLRDARNAPGMHFSVSEAVEIAKRLDALGIEEIEAGFLNGAETEAALLDALAGANLKASISSMVLCYNTNTIDRSLDFGLEHGVKNVVLSIPTSEPFIAAKLKRSLRATKSLLQRAVKAAVDRGMTVAFSGEDAARSDVDWLIDYANAGADAGAHRFRFAESVSSLTPGDMAERVGRLKQQVGIPIEVHCHSALGLGVANTVAAIEAGAAWVSVTVDGIGERGGNTPLAPILLYLYQFKNKHAYQPQHLKPLSDYVCRITNNAAAAFAPITGDQSFYYEYLHQFQRPELYDAFPPDLVGNHRELVYGLRFDRHAYHGVLDLEDSLDELKQLVASEVVRNKRPVKLDTLRALVQALGHVS